MGITSMQVTEVDTASDGSSLLLYTSGGAPYASFFDGTAFSGAISLPANTTTVHADAAHHVFAVDTSHILWDGTSGTFVNRGAIPFQSATDALSPEWDWAVTPGSVVYVGYAASLAGDPTVYVESFDAAHSWTSPVQLVISYDMTDSFSEFAMAVAWMARSTLRSLTDTKKGPRATTAACCEYARSVDGETWSTPELLHGVDTYEDNNVIPSVGAFVARNYDGAEALLVEVGGSMLGNYSMFARRCGTPGFNGWPTTSLPQDPGSFDITAMAVNALGYPSFLLTETGGRGVVGTD